LQRSQHQSTALVDGRSGEGGGVAQRQRFNCIYMSCGKLRLLFASFLLFLFPVVLVIVFVPCHLLLAL